MMHASLIVTDMEYSRMDDGYPYTSIISKLNKDLGDIT